MDRPTVPPMTAIQEYIKQGFPVFPLREPGEIYINRKGVQQVADGKEPAVPNWRAIPPNCKPFPGGFGVAITAAHFVLDVDGEVGYRELADLEKKLGVSLRGECRAITGGGGLHVFFRLSPDQAKQQTPYKVPQEYQNLEFCRHGRYVVGVGSPHASGGTYLWDPFGATLGELEELPYVPEELWSWLIQKSAERQTFSKEGIEGFDDSDANKTFCERWLNQAPVSVQGQNGDSTAFKTAAHLRDLGLSGDAALELMLTHWNSRCEPPWSEEELAEKVLNAYQYSSGAVGSRNPAAFFQSLPDEPETLMPTFDAKNAPANARIWLKHNYPDESLIRHEGTFYSWSGKTWEPWHKERLPHEIQVALQYSCPQATINSTVTAVKFTVVKNDIRRNPAVIAFDNCAVDLTDWAHPEIRAHRKEDYCLVYRPWSFDPDAKCLEWEAFLNSAFEGDSERIALLQEWMGYALVEDTRFQKILLMLGRSRAGKGVVSNIMEYMLGPNGARGGALEDAADKFGLDDYRDCRLAILSEVDKLPKRMHGPALRWLLSISAGDPTMIQVKRERGVAKRLPLRIALNCNEPPMFHDAGSALINRYLVLPFDKSFAGREDFDLESKLKREIAAITAWAIGGLVRLKNKGAFTIPRAGAKRLLELREFQNPLEIFVADCIEVFPGAEAPTADVYGAYKFWCAQNGRSPLSDARFGEQMKLCIPGLEKVRARTSDDKSLRNFYKGVRLMSESIDIGSFTKGDF